VVDFVVSGTQLTSGAWVRFLKHCPLITMYKSEDFFRLSQQIATLEKRSDKLADYLKSALNYLSSDPQSSLTKCRIVLEKILTNIYIREMGKEPSKGMIGNILSDKEFATKIPSRIRARMNFIREIANLGPHGGEVEIEDAHRVLRDVVYLTEWYVSHYDLLNTPQPENAQVVEILPQLKVKYADYLRTDVTSVKLGQTIDRCYLEITTTNLVADYLHDESIKRTDLGFITDEDNDSLFFKPERSINENAQRFIKEFDEIGIINCTDLFTEQATTMIYEHWNEHGKTPLGE
jgi:hypothetical protein